MTPVASSPSAGHRILFLDGLRGAAIFWVMLFHAYVRWPDAVPFGNQYSGVPLVAYGWLGVQLFFMISGFVILMTLENSASFGEFMWRRWLRLFPAMLLCSALIFVSAPIFHERPAGPAQVRDLLPGLTFIDPAWLALAFGSPQGVLEGAFWSLFVEMKFYVIAGALYFLVGGNRMIAALFGLFLVVPATLAIAAIFPGADVRAPQLFAEWFSLRYFGWFTAGALYYRYFRDPNSTVLGLAVVAALAAAAAQDGYQRYPQVFALSVVIAFTLAMTSPWVRRLLTSRFALFLGFVSYPLYLIHENMMVSAIAKLGKMAPSLPASLLPVLPMLWVCAVAWLVARFAEPWLREKIRRLRAKPVCSSYP